MSYSNQTINNKSSIKRFSHKRRFQVALSLLDLKINDSILDFGTGEGHLLKLLAEQKDVKEIVGYEPVIDMFQELSVNIENLNYNNIQIIYDLESLKEKEFDYVSCFEVFEHFSKNEQNKFLEEIRKITKNDGHIIISVPLEIGLSALFKNTIRILVGQKQSNSSLKSIMKAVFCFPDNRIQKGYIHSHIGFNHNNLEELFKINQLKIIKKQYSPFKYLFGLLNSQIFYILKKV
jgi:2-polyprenyl-3-methyl-5-hydroxy-6-metoxy-1,4-benzoquinol methylase